MEFTLQRQDQFIRGVLRIDNSEFLTLENGSKAIPAGRYGVEITVSGRAVAGTLWSPRADHRLPLLLNVPGRSGIRIHAANEREQLEGCIAPGMDRTGEGVLIASRPALIAIMAKLTAAQDEMCWLTITDPQGDISNAQASC